MLYQPGDSPPSHSAQSLTPAKPGSRGNSAPHSKPTRARGVMQRLGCGVVSSVRPQSSGGFHLAMPIKPHVRWACDSYLGDKPRQIGFRRPAIDLAHCDNWVRPVRCAVASRFAGSGLHPHVKKWLTILHSPSIYISQDPRCPADLGL